MPSPGAVIPERLRQSELKIVSVDAYPVRLRSRWWPVRRRPRFGSDDDPARHRYRGPFAQLASTIIVIIKTNGGITGFGMGAGGRIGVEIIHGHLRDLLVGADPAHIERLWDQMYDSALFYGRRGVFVMALSGVDNALWDIRGKLAGQSVTAMIGGQSKSRVPAYLTGGRIGRGLDLGFDAFKVVAAYGPEHGESGIRKTLEKVRAARRKIGADRLLMLDCATAWQTVPHAVDMVRRLQDANLYFIEEPLSPDNIYGYAQLIRELQSPPIASGEHEYTQHGFDVLLRQRAVQVLQPDVCWSGGLTAVLRIAELAEAHALPIIPHRGGSLYGLPIALTRKHCPLAEALGAETAATDVLRAVSGRFRDGYYYPSEEPGFGTRLTEDIVLANRLDA